jgi:hypothetical protein
MGEGRLPILNGLTILARLAKGKAGERAAAPI